MNRILAMVVALLVAMPALAARAELSVRTRDMAVGQVAELELTVVEGRPVAIPRLAAPEGLEVAFRDQGYRTLVHNTQIVRLWELSYSLKATAEGDWTLGPYEVQLDNGVVRTNAVTVHVEPTPTLDAAPLAVEAAFEPAVAWEGQVVLYRYRLTHRVEVKASQWNLPEFSGLVAPRDGTRPRQRYTLQDETGLVAVDESWLPWVVTGTGDLTQPPAAVRVDVPTERDQRRDVFDPFGHFTPTRAERLVTGPASLTARPLPPAPPGFTGLVGDFSFEASLDRTRAAVGESLSWTVEVEGDGTLEGFELPRLSPDEGARVYEGSPTIEAEVAAGAYRAQGTLSQVIVPTAVGRLELPPLEVVVFSPSRGDFVTHTLSVPPLEITPGEEGEADVESFSVAPVVPEPGPGDGFQERDIRPPRGAAPAFIAPVDRLLPLLLGAAATPGLVALLLLGRRRWREKRAARERGEVVLTPSQRLKRLPAEPLARLAALDGALREALARRVGVEVTHLDRESALASLPEDLSSQVAGVLSALDRARFGGGGAGAVDEAAVRDAVRALEET